MSLINGSPCASALVADATLSARNRLALAERVCALTAEVIRTPDEQHSELLEALWEEQHEVAALRSLRELLAGGAGERRHFQAPVSFRILPRVLGRLRRATAEAERAATSSLAAVSDNPVYVPPCEGYPLGATLSNGSYHNAQAPPAMDGLAAAWADICQLLERQTERLLTDVTVFGEGHVPVKILYMVQTWWAEEARATAQPTLIPLGGYGQNDTCAPSFFAWRRQEQVGRCLDAAMAIVSAIASQALADADREPPAALAGLFAERARQVPRRDRVAPAGRGSRQARRVVHGARAGVSARFVPSVAPLVKATRIWIGIRGMDVLVLDRGERDELPSAAEVDALGVVPLRSLYLGELDGVPCRSAELPDDHEAPPGWRSARCATSTGVSTSSVDAGRPRRAARRVGSHAPPLRRAAARPPSTPRVSGRAAARSAATPRSRACRRRSSCASREATRSCSRAARRFPGRLYSVLAGFVEPGESLEECVARELRGGGRHRGRRHQLFREPALAVSHSLMIGFTATWVSRRAAHRGGRVGGREAGSRATTSPISPVACRSRAG